MSINWLQPYSYARVTKNHLKRKEKFLLQERFRSVQSVDFPQPPPLLAQLLFLSFVLATPKALRQMPGVLLYQMMLSRQWQKDSGKPLGDCVNFSCAGALFLIIRNCTLHHFHLFFWGGVGNLTLLDFRQKPSSIGLLTCEHRSGDLCYNWISSLI